MIEKTGGGEENHIKKAMIVIQSFADSLYRAAEINEEVKNKDYELLDKALLTEENEKLKKENEELKRQLSEEKNLEDDMEI